MANKHVCPICIIQILHEDKSIQCESKCSRFFHAECVKLSHIEYSKYVNPRTNEKCKWVCRRADCTQGIDQQSIGALFTQLSLLTSTISDLSNKVGLLTPLPGKVDTLITDVDRLNKNLESLNQRVSTNEDRIKALEDSLQNGAAAANTMSPDAVIAEINDRQSRMNNVILYKVPESDHTNNADKKEHDRSKLLTILASANLSHEDVRTFFRIGKRGSTGPRPIKLILKSRELALILTKNWNIGTIAENDDTLINVSMTSDKTPNERSFLGNLRGELKKRIENGEPDLTIKYINGVPRIVSDKKKTS